ncbi:MAG: DUF1295 domain-containing protein [Myxococcales bacterium]|nr:DUF1295 domain-containing protein [Myxococcales bacterium]
MSETTSEATSAATTGERSGTTQSRRASFALITLVYLVALGASAAVWITIDDGPFWRAAYADLVGTAVVFLGSLLLRSSSVYDPYWSVAPPLLVGGWMIELGASPRAWLVLALVTLWGARLTWNWARGYPGLPHEDWRYVDIRRQCVDATGHVAVYWVVSFLGIHLFPTIQVFLGLLGAYVAIATDAALGPFDAVAAVVTLAAIAIEAVADRQLHAFNRDKRPGEILDRGLWAWSRHPNYFGEILFWWGLWLFTLSVSPTPLFALAGPLAITVMFLVVSLPMLEKRSRARRPTYAEHARRTSLLVPWPPRRG